MTATYVTGNIFIPTKRETDEERVAYVPVRHAEIKARNWARMPGKRLAWKCTSLSLRLFSRLILPFLFIFVFIPLPV